MFNITNKELVFGRVLIAGYGIATFMLIINLMLSLYLNNPNLKENRALAKQETPLRFEVKMNGLTCYEYLEDKTLVFDCDIKE